MEHTLVIVKPSGVERRLVGAIINRFEAKGLVIVGLKMMQLDEAILREHYSHLVDKPFFHSLVESMMATPVVVMCLAGVDAISCVRAMTGVTNGRKAAPGTIRGDYSMSGQMNIIHASDSQESALAEVKRFFRHGELFDYAYANLSEIYADDELPND